MSVRKDFSIKNVQIKRKELENNSEQFDLKYYLFLIQNLVIDLLVYDLYGLTEEGVQIVDPDFTLTKESYDDFKNVL